MILWTYAYFVDNDQRTIERKQANADYTAYVNFLLKSILTSNKLSHYVPTSDTAEVVSCVKDSTRLSTIEESNSNSIQHVVNNCDAITKRFLQKEIEAQHNVCPMNIKIKSGCLIHAFIKEKNIYQYLIAKMDWADFLERVSLNLSQGIEVDSKHLGKSCLFDINIEENNITITDSQVLLDNKATYFWKNFLELDPIYKDDYCTETMVDTTVKLIDNCFKKKYPQDRLVLKNSFIHYVKSNDFIDFDDIQTQVFQHYLDAPCCAIDSIDCLHFIDKIKNLPESKKFSRQFNRVAEKVNVNIVKSAYRLTPFANLEIHDADSDQRDVLKEIKSGNDEDGSTFLKIYTDNEEAIQTFKPKV